MAAFQTPKVRPRSHGLQSLDLNHWSLSCPLNTSIVEEDELDSPDISAVCKAPSDAIQDLNLVKLPREESSLKPSDEGGILDDWIHVELSDISPLPKDTNGQIMYKQLTMKQYLLVNLELKPSDKPIL